MKRQFMVDLMEAGEVDTLVSECPRYAQEARVDMGFKHLAFILRAVSDTFTGARVQDRRADTHRGILKVNFGFL